MQYVLLTLIRWIAIHLSVKVIHPFNNQGQDISLQNLSHTEFSKRNLNKNWKSSVRAVKTDIEPDKTKKPDLLVAGQLCQ